MVIERNGKPSDKAPKAPLENHQRLRVSKKERQKQDKANCPGNHEPWAIKQGLWLGGVVNTEVVELWLQTPDGVGLTDPVAAYTLAVALSQALAAWLGIEDAEIGYTLGPVTDAGRAIYLFDTASGGAGYTTQLSRDWLGLWYRTRAILAECACDQACQRCLLDYRSQHHGDWLDRKRGLAVWGELPHDGGVVVMRELGVPEPGGG